MLLPGQILTGPTRSAGIPARCTPTADNTDIFGPVQPVGGPNPTIINDFYTALDDVGYDDRVICECVTDPGKGGANV